MFQNNSTKLYPVLRFNIMSISSAIEWVEENPRTAALTVGAVAGGLLAARALAGEAFESALGNAIGGPMKMADNVTAQVFEKGFQFTADDTGLMVKAIKG